MLDIDCSCLPLIRMATTGTPDDQEHKATLRELTALLLNTEHPLFILQDTGDARLTMDQRKRQAAWIKDNADSFKRRCAGIAFVFPSATTRFVLSSIMLLSGNPAEYVVVGTLEEAVRWAEGQLQRRGVTLPAPARAWSSAPRRPQ